METNIKALRDSRGPDVHMMTLANVTEKPGFNVRQDRPELAGHIAWLCDSLEAEGWRVSEPLRGYMGPDGKVIVTNGHCRLMALRQLVESGRVAPDDIKIPVVTEGRAANEGDYIATMLYSNAGLELTALEKAEVCRRLLKYGWPSDKIAKAANVTRQSVEGLLVLSSAPPVVKEMVQTGEIKATTAINAIRADGPDKAATVLQETVAHAKATRTKATGKAVKKMREAKAPQTDKPKPKQTTAAAQLAELGEIWQDAHTRADNGNVIVTMTAAQAKRCDELLLGETVR